MSNLLLINNSIRLAKEISSSPSSIYPQFRNFRGQLKNNEGSSFDAEARKWNGRWNLALQERTHPRIPRFLQHPASNRMETIWKSPLTIWTTNESKSRRCAPRQL